MPASYREGGDGVTHFRQLVEELAEELHELDYGRLEQLIIHGDATTGKPRDCQPPAAHRRPD